MFFKVKIILTPIIFIISKRSRLLPFAIIFLISYKTQAQKDTSIKYNKKLATSIAMANAGVYGASMIGLYSAWYKNYPQEKFHVFNDFAEWKQIDKIGHAYSAYSMGRFSMEMWKSTGIDKKKRIWIGGLTGTAYQTVIEMLDGFSSQWGWSWTDIGANIIGSGMLISQEFAWNEQRIQFKTSFHRKFYDDAILNARSNFLFGQSSPERFLKDYNGQTYWLSANLKSFFPKSKIPDWLEVSAGTGAEGLFGARSNIARDENGSISFERTDIRRIRQWYLAPDVDFTKIKSKHKFIRATLFVLNSLKFPTPALEMNRNGLKFHWLYF